MILNSLFDAQLLEKYNTTGPRYTSYPTALAFSDAFSASDMQHASLNSANSELSIYVHIPFCHSLCYYCGCNKIVTRHQDKADRYLDFLEKEVTLKATCFKKHVVSQIHLGGGTPSFLSMTQMTRLVKMLRQHFTFSEQERGGKRAVDMSIEIDPRKIDLEYLDGLKELGFNRLSIGVQDTNEQVQQAINRVQDKGFIKSLVTRAKNLGFDSVNLDLIYGLPHQTLASTKKTLDDVALLNADRISLFSYAHLPSRFAAQCKIKDAWLPEPQTKFNIMKLAIETLSVTGFEMIGIDHFARSDDELTKAQRSGKLHRNFQGYTTHGHCDLLGLGASAISSVGNALGQNYKLLNDYYTALNENEIPIEKGITLSRDDLIRGQVIRDIMCNMHLDIAALEQKFDINFVEYFAESLNKLIPFVEDDIVNIDAKYIRVHPNARLLLRNICMCFDAHLEMPQHRTAYSRVI